jgi:hypothetical protein
MKLEILTDALERPLVSEAPSPFRPDYRGLEWLEADLPRTHRPWIARKPGLVVVPVEAYESEVSHGAIKEYIAGKPWVWPDRTIHFLCDQHADADAFMASLVASGGVAKTGPADGDFELTEEGRNALFIIGGDCIDKGPENLRLLRALRALIDMGADVEILAGNHDLRLFVGLRYAFRKDDARLAHLLVRMGKKAAPLFREVHDAYPRNGGERPVSDAKARQALFPDDGWYEAFPGAVADIMSEASVVKEMKRIRQKTVELEERARELGLSLGQVHAAVEKCRDLFLTPDGEFSWLFRRMKLACRAGSFLFVHAGVDDVVAAEICNGGVDHLNRMFHALLEDDPFTLYHGPVGNAFRTKYRGNNWPLTAKGVRHMREAGLYAIVHGHRNILRGQRMILRHGLLNFECDASVDRNTRASEGLTGPGGAVTTLRPDGRMLGISTDCPYIKLFDPADFSAMTAIV